MPDDFIKALEDAQAMPELPDELASQVPDLLAGALKKQLVTRVDPDDPDKIPNTTKLDFDFHCARLMMGQIQTGFSHGQAEYVDRDDSERLKEIMDMHLKGAAVVHNKKETFLKDGTVVIWVEWMTPKKQVPKDDRSWLHYEELTSPERLVDSTKDSGE